MSTLHVDIKKEGVFRVHPVVVFSILDHHKRRKEGQDRVVGTLLGYRDGLQTIHITNSFPVPHTEDDDSVQLDMAHNQKMLELHSRVNPREKVVGWYSSSATVGMNSLTIHGMYMPYVQAPVHLTVDAELTDSRMDIKAYTAHAIAAKGKPVVTRFEEVEMYQESSEPERIAIDALINSTPDDNQSLDAPATLLSDLDNLELSLSNLLQAIEDVRAYVARVVAGEIKGDDDLCRAISHALSAVPSMDSESFERLFATHVRDLLLVVYLSNLTRAQVALADKVIGLL